MHGNGTARELLENSLRRIALHDHACLIFDSDEVQLQANSAFVRRGLEVGDRCMCVADTGNVHQIEAALRASGIAVDGAAAHRALEVTTERSAYLAGGAFDPEVMSAVLTETALRAADEGFRGLRIAGEVTWALGGDLGADRIMEYETRVNELLPRIPCLALCHYDRRRFSAEVIRDVIRTHPLALVRGRLCRNFYYVPPGELVGPDRLHAEIDRLLDNVHERAQAEEALRASERRLELVLEGAQAAFWDLELREDRITFSGPWAAAVGFEAPEEPQAVEAWRARIHPEDRAATVRALEEHVAGAAAAYVGEHRVRFADGSWRWVLARGRVVARDAGGAPVRVAGTMTDVTDRHALQARLELSSRLASVGTLAAGVAHEINNPLTFLDANLRWAIDQLDAGAGVAAGELRAALGDALDGATRVREIVQELRRFAQPARGGGASATSDVETELRAAIAIVRRHVAARAQLRVELEPALPAVRVSPRELGQVVVNLLANAAEAIPVGHAAENQIRVLGRREGDALVLEIGDTGPGIAPDVLPHIFDPFYTTKEIGNGSGLGLAICHGIVEAAGGTIAVESEAGRGALFRVRLPAAAHVPAPGAPARGQPAPHRRRILVVDDEPLVGRAIQRALSGDHEVEVLTSPTAALRRLQGGERWDLVLCDLLMPELGGAQLAEELRRSAPDVLPHLVFMTGGTRAEGTDRTSTVAGQRILEKPLSFDTLRALLAAP